MQFRLRVRRLYETDKRTEKRTDGQDHYYDDRSITIAVIKENFYVAATRRKPHCIQYKRALLQEQQHL